MSLLGDIDIWKEMQDLRIVIDPLNESQLKANSYDLRLWNWFWWAGMDSAGERAYYGPIYIQDGERVHIPNGGTILAATIEVVTTAFGIVGKIKSKSSTRRHMISVVTDAGLGDDGYNARWTLELSGHSCSGPYYPYLEVGEPVCQIYFDELRTPSSSGYQGQYNNDDWPLAMLPVKDRPNIRPAEKWMIDVLTTGRVI